MHEASLMRAIMNRLNEIARIEGARRISSVSVWLGALSHMSAAHFTEHFNESAAGSIAEGAHLDITVSDDMDDPEAQQILIKSVEIET